MTNRTPDLLQLHSIMIATLYLDFIMIQSLESQLICGDTFYPLFFMKHFVRPLVKLFSIGTSNSTIYPKLANFMECFEPILFCRAL